MLMKELTDLLLPDYDDLIAERFKFIQQHWIRGEQDSTILPYLLASCEGLDDII